MWLYIIMAEMETGGLEGQVKLNTSFFKKKSALKQIRWETGEKEIKGVVEGRKTNKTECLMIHNKDV